MAKLNPKLIGGILLLGIAMTALWARRQRDDPAPFPAGQRLLLALPRPFLNRDRLRRLLAPGPGERILEIGPGTGYYTLDIAAAIAPSGRLDALDLQPAMLDTLRRRAAAQGVTNIVTTQGDAQALPFPSETFDAAFLVATLGEIPAPGTALGEIRRVLKPGGRLVVGEGQPDPHMITLPELRRLAHEAQLNYNHQEGGALGYAARFLAG